MISTEPEFSPNDLKLMSAVSKNYFVKQYMKMELFVSGANLQFVDEAEEWEESGKL